MKESEVKHALKWVAGIVLVIGGIAHTSWGGAIFILIGLLTIPPISKTIGNELRLQVPRPLKYVIVIIASLIMIGSLGENQSTTDQASNETTKKDSIPQPDQLVADYVIPEVKAPEPAPNYFVIIDSPEIFRTRFNYFMRELKNNSLNVGRISISKGEVNDAFTYIFNKNVGIVGQINKSDNSIRSIMLTLQGDGTLTSGADIMTSIMSVIHATNPELTPDQRGNILRELRLLDKDIDINNIQSSTISNNIRYSLQGSEIIGLLFVAESADEDSE